MECNNLFTLRKAMTVQLTADPNYSVPCVTSIMNTLTSWHHFFIYCKNGDSI